MTDIDEKLLRLVQLTRDAELHYADGKRVTAASTEAEADDLLRGLSALYREQAARIAELEAALATRSGPVRTNVILTSSETAVTRRALGGSP